jgi:hypothetical protein
VIERYPWLAQAANILIATGARAFVPPIEGAEHAIISDDILDLPELPRKIAVIGGGYIALEFAGIYNNFGTEVHVLYRQVGHSLLQSLLSPFPGASLVRAYMRVWQPGPQNSMQSMHQALLQSCKARGAPRHFTAVPCLVPLGRA